MRTRTFGAALAALAMLVGGLSGASADAAGTVAVRLAPGGAQGLDAAFSASYGSFDWAVVEESQLGDLSAVEVHREAGTIVLPSARFDPLIAPPAAAAPPGRSLHVIQFHGPLKDAWVDVARARGATLVQYLAPFSYVALLDRAHAAAISAMPSVRWVGPFDPSYRFGNLDLAGASLANAVLIDDGAAEATIAALRSLGVDVRVTPQRIPFADVDAVGIQVPASAVRVLRRLANVYSIAPQLRGAPRDEMSNQIVAGNYNASNVPQVGYRPWLAAEGLSGAGVVVAHVDDGYQATHPDTALTVSGCRNYAVPTNACSEVTGTQSDFHGQHTGGIIVGTGTVPATDGSGFTYGLGVAPGAKLYVQNFIGLESFFTPTGSGQYLTLNQHSVLGGATISANSWGPSGTPRGYDADTREFDHAPRDANLATPQHEPLAFVLSIMNGSGGTSTQGTPDEGKNLIRVGSTKNFRSGAINNLGASSAHGPALDGRRLPDLVAPGERVVSTSNGATTALCLDPVVDPDGAVLYSSCTGTSMASPHVSGASALFTEWWRKANAGATPSPAMIKAAFVNGAVDLFGARDADNGVLGHVPDNKQGWGRIHLGNVFGGTEKDYLDQSVVLGATGQSWTGTVDPVDPAKPVKVSLVWTDAPGPGLGGSTPAWVNDLDLRVTEGTGEEAVTYLGNAFGTPSTGWSQPGGVADFRNNIENVYLQSASGPLTLQVLGANIAGDGVPGVGDDTDQDFALVISNGHLR